MPCAESTPAVTFFVGRFATALAVDGAQAHRTESTVCPRRFAAFVGGTPEDRRLSLLRTVWFAPTVEQAAAGAQWFECVAIALRGDEHLALLDVPGPGLLDSDTGATTTACAPPTSPAAKGSSSASAP